ncbi:MAG: amino acid permease [Myxococcales bacterium FL481]|nr:MAG: amino acid permease [Myxococcales bacterium FL481]
MPAKDGKFGTFGGVYTPSLLTILGVIMYLRLPWVVGSAGLWQTLGIITVAHVVSLSTGMSISSIATDKKVGAGGPYYIVSRSLGLPIGGTLGLALFLGLSFSISLYVIGFCESLLATLPGTEISVDNIRIYGTAVVTGLTIITLISTAIAIKMQYIIMALIAGSLISIGLGATADIPTAPLLQPPADGPELNAMFAIFFPAVTGFTAGVNMSGDLRDSRRAIPLGTMASIITGAAVYVALAVFLAYRVGPERLVQDGEVLRNIAAWPPAVLGGIWGATLSSAIGSILGAPRILQALGRDRIMPKFFARGYGKTAEPRNALIPAFLIAEAGILVAELDVIARVVSMVFLTTYGFLNLSCWLESLTSPDFRPSWKIPNLIPLTGAVVCTVLMIQLDLPSMAGAIAGMLAVFVVLERRHLKLDSGDAWEGIWANLVRSGLSYLSRATGAQRNWRPNILLFRRSENAPLHRFASALVSGNGMVTDFELVTSQRAETTSPEPAVGVFHERIVTDTPYETVAAICRYHGFAGLAPNTVLLDLQEHRENPPELARLLQAARDRDYNLLLLATASGASTKRERIDVWWRSEAGNFPFSVSLGRFILGTDHWAKARVRFLIFSEDSSHNDALRTRARELLREFRVDATVRVLNARSLRHGFESAVVEESSDANLVMLGLQDNAQDEAGAGIERVLELIDRLPTVLLLRASTAFKEVLPVTARTAPHAAGEPAPPTQLDLPPMSLSPVAELSQASLDFCQAFDELATHLFDDGVARSHATNLDRLESLADGIAGQFAALEKQLDGANPRRRKHAVNRTQSAFLKLARTFLAETEESVVQAQRAVFDGAIDGFVASPARGPGLHTELTVTRPREDFRPDPHDSAWLLRFKRRRRWSAWLRRDAPRYEVPIGRMYVQAFDEACRELLQPEIFAAARHQHQHAVALSRTLKAVSTSLTKLGQAIGRGEWSAELLGEERQAAAARLDQMLGDERRAHAEARERILTGGRNLAVRFATEVDRLDVTRLVRRRKSPERHATPAAYADELHAYTTIWADNQRLLVARGRLGLDLSGFQHRLAATADKAQQALSLQIRNGTLSDCEALVDKIQAVAQEAQADGADPASLPRPKLAASCVARFDPAPILSTLVRETEPAIGELAESVSTLQDDAIRRLQEGSREPAATIDLSLRRLVQFLLESEFVASLAEAVAAVHPTEERAAGIARDVSRLLTFQLSELDATDEADARDAVSQLSSVLDNSLSRLKPEVEALTKLAPSLGDLIERKLARIFAAIDTFDLSDQSSDVRQQLARVPGQRAVSWLRQTATAATDVVVGLIYRRSAGVLLARRLRAGTLGSEVERLQRLVRESSPRAEVINALPFFYRQLFFGQASFDEGFWVGRDEELGLARNALASYRRGAQGALFVVGDAGSGKSAMCQRIVAKLLGGARIARVDARRGGSIEPEHFASALIRAAGQDPGDPAACDRHHVDLALRSLPEGSVVLIDDLELWWERSSPGLANIDELIRLITEHGRRVLFIVAMGSLPFRFVERFRQLSEYALAVIECGPVPARTLESIVRLRHGSTGLRYEFAGRSETELTKWRLARLFSAHFDYALGNVGAALRGWITHIERVQDDGLILRPPEPRAWDVLDELRPPWRALLTQFLLHRQLTEPRLARVTGLPAVELRGQIDSLVRVGLLSRGRYDVLELNRFVQHVVTDRFVKRGFV